MRHFQSEACNLVWQTCPKTTREALKSFDDQSNFKAD